MMNKSTETIELKFERSIPAPPAKVFDAWLSTEVPGNPWSMADKVILQPHVDGLFYSCLMGTAHFGRFVQVDRPGRLQHSWVSPATFGQETMVTVTFSEQGGGTLLTLVHTGLTDTEKGKSHNAGWNFFLDKLREQFVQAGEKA
jgi:uncharacterized protein YndB with AHSA1/START domain